MKSPVVAAVGLVTALALLTVALFGVALSSATLFNAAPSSTALPGAAVPTAAQEPDPLGRTGC